MEILLSLIFYDSRWTILKRLYPSLKFLQILQYFLILIGFLQTTIIVFDKYNTKKLNLNSSEEFYFAISSFITLSSSYLLIIRTNYFYNTEFGFIKKAEKYDDSVSIKLFEPIIRRRSFESAIGFSNIVFSVFKLILTLKSTFIEEFSEKFAMECYSDAADIIMSTTTDASNVISIPKLLSECNNKDNIQLIKLVVWFLFEFYQKISLIVVYYLVFIFIYFTIVKVGFVLICCLNDDLTIKILTLISKKSKELDEKTRGICLQVIRLVLNSNMTKKSNTDSTLDNKAPSQLSEYDLILKKNT